MLHGKDNTLILFAETKKRVNFQILSPYSSATRTVNCLDVYILSVSLLELLPKVDSSSKAEATTSNKDLFKS